VSVIILDGPVGTELNARGIPTPLPGWSAHALESTPEAVSAVHRDYAAAGARVHTTNTFRTRPDVFGDRWCDMARLAVRLVREAVPADQRVAGSIAPLADCYRPDLSPATHDPARTRREHGELARLLADEGCDLLLCETFPCVVEASIALEEAVATGLETWVSWTPGPQADLLTPAQVAEAARGAVARGASGVLVNCLPVARTLPFVQALVEAVGTTGTLVGAYANAGRAEAVDGWHSDEVEPSRYARVAGEWQAAGASILGGCCGTGPAVVAALASR
jgi:S-methylmethionine-dependent homocysteine/selenocysteine methylase